MIMKYLFLLLLISFACEGQMLPVQSALLYKKKQGYNFTGITDAVYTGNSIAAGSLASAGNSYRELLTAEYSWAEANISVGGRGVWRELDEINTESFTRTQTVILVEGGLNDLRRSVTTQTYNKIRTCTFGILKRAFSSTTQVASGNAAVTRASGTFVQFDARSLGGIYDGGPIPDPATATFSSTLNATWTWSFTGTDVYVLFSGSNGAAARGDAEVRIDGNLVDTITDLDNQYDGVSDGAYDNARGPVCKIYWDLAAGAHTIEVKNISTSPVPIDQFGVLETPANTGYVFMVQIPKVNDYAKPGLDQADDAALTAGDAIRQEVLAEFQSRGYKVYFIPIMLGEGGLYDRSVGTDVDGVHPNDIGHNQIFESIRRFIYYWIPPMMVVSFRKRKKDDEDDEYKEAA